MAIGEFPSYSWMASVSDLVASSALRTHVANNVLKKGKKYFQRFILLLNDNWSNLTAFAGCVLCTSNKGCGVALVKLTKTKPHHEVIFLLKEDFTVTLSRSVWWPSSGGGFLWHGGGNHRLQQGWHLMNQFSVFSLTTISLKAKRKTVVCATIGHCSWNWLISNLLLGSDNYTALQLLILLF